jgi:xanthine dehydrogenase accessory factor
MEIHRKIVELIESRQPFAVVQILGTQGSAPLKAGTKAVVEANGRIWGTVGGGAVEAEAQRRAIEACASGRTSVFDFQLHGQHRRDAEPVCGGSMRLLVNPLASRQSETLRRVTDCLKNRQRGLLLTQVPHDTNTEVSLTWIPEQAVADRKGFPDGACLLSCLKRESADLFVDPTTETEVLVEPILPRPHLVIAGGGHVGQALARQAVLVDFEVTVVDDRPEFTAVDLFAPEVHALCGDIAAKVARLAESPDTYIVIVTHGHEYDAAVLEACFHGSATYIGMIGSRRKIAVLRQDFIESGLATAAQFDRIHAPIGLDIGSVTAAEIAASIVAQLIAVRRQGTSR